MKMTHHSRESARKAPERIPQDVIDEIIAKPGEMLAGPLQGKEKIDALINHGKTFESKYYQLALKAAADYAGQNGFIATAPMLIAAMTMNGQSRFENKKLSTLSEKNFGSRVIDDYSKKTLIMGTATIIIHGGGTLTPEYVFSQVNMLVHAIRPTAKTIMELLKGKLPNGESIEIYSISDIRKNKVKDLFSRYGVAITLAERSAHKNGKIPVEQFLNHPLALAIAGSSNLLEDLVLNYQLSNDSMATSVSFPKETSLITRASESVGVSLTIGENIDFSYCRPVAEGGSFVAVRYGGTK